MVEKETEARLNELLEFKQSQLKLMWNGQVPYEEKLREL